jgi:hypothetical protein
MKRVLRSLLLPALMLSLLLVGPCLSAQAAIEEAVFGGGCFWCLEHDLEHLKGVVDAESGYSGGRVAKPSYGQVSAGGTGHQEVVRVRFDNAKISYPTLLRAYWRNVDPWSRPAPVVLQRPVSWGDQPLRSRCRSNRFKPSGLQRAITRTTPRTTRSNTAITAGLAAVIVAWMRCGDQRPGRRVHGLPSPHESLNRNLRKS